MANLILNRRRLLRLGAVSAVSLTLSGCDQFDQWLGMDQPLRSFLEKGNELTYAAQRALVGRDALAKTYPASAIRQPARPNGSTDPQTADYLALKANDFVDYQLKITGLVEKPQSFSLAQLKAMPAQSQITRHDCVEGWSYIAKWTGTRLGPVVDAAKPKPEARYAVYHCFDAIEQGLSGDILYYESSDLIDVHHPQTILAYGLNDKTLPIENGAPIRVRIPRALGYKQAKYLHTIELVSSFAKLGDGHGGYWEDNGYDWFGGI